MLNYKPLTNITVISGRKFTLQERPDVISGENESTLNKPIWPLVLKIVRIIK